MEDRERNFLWTQKPALGIKIPSQMPYQSKQKGRSSSSGDWGLSVKYQKNKPFTPDIRLISRVFPRLADRNPDPGAQPDVWHAP
jgi:hypothetical protein